MPWQGTDLGQDALVVADPAGRQHQAGRVDEAQPDALDAALHHLHLHWKDDSLADMVLEACDQRMVQLLRMSMSCCTLVTPTSIGSDAARAHGVMRRARTPAAHLLGGGPKGISVAGLTAQQRVDDGGLAAA